MPVGLEGFRSKYEIIARRVDGEHLGNPPEVAHGLQQVRHGARSGTRSLESIESAQARRTAKSKNSPFGTRATIRIF